MQFWNVVVNQQFLSLCQSQSLFFRFIYQSSQLSNLKTSVDGPYSPFYFHSTGAILLGPQTQKELKFQVAWVSLLPDLNPQLGEGGIWRWQASQRNSHRVVLEMGTTHTNAKRRLNLEDNFTIKRFKLYNVLKSRSRYLFSIQKKIYKKRTTIIRVFVKESDVRCHSNTFEQGFMD